MKFKNYSTEKDQNAIFETAEAVEFVCGDRLNWNSYPGAVEALECALFNTKEFLGRLVALLEAEGLEGSKIAELLGPSWEQAKP